MGRLRRRCSYRFAPSSHTGRGSCAVSNRGRADTCRRRRRDHGRSDVDLDPGADARPGEHREERNPVPARAPIDFEHLLSTTRAVAYRFRLSPERRFEYLTPSIADISGYQPDELYADPALVLRLVHPDDHEALRRLFTSEAPDERLRLRLVHRDGRIIWMQHHTVAVYEEQGTIAGIDGVACEIGNGSPVEAELERANERLHALVAGNLAITTHFSLDAILQDLA